MLPGERHAAGSWGRSGALTKRDASVKKQRMSSRFSDLHLTMFTRSTIFSACRRPVIPQLLRQTQNQCLHASPALALPRRRDFFTSNAQLAQKQSNTNDESLENLELQKQRRRSARAPAAPTSLRRVAVEAQRSRDGFLSKAQLKEQGIDQTKVTLTNKPR